MRVDDVADRFVGQAANGRDHRVAHVRDRRIDDQDALVADLQRDVAAGADEHEDVPLHGQDVNVGCVGRNEHGGKRGHEREPQRDRADLVQDGAHTATA